MYDKIWNPISIEDGQASLHLQRGCDPLRMRKPKAIGVKSDWAHEAVPDEFRDRMFAVMALCPQHQFIVLTKRPERAVEWASRPRIRPEVLTRAGQRGVRGWSDEDYHKIEWPLPNVWMGFSVSNQADLDRMGPDIMRIAALGWRAWISYEPALGVVDFEPFFTFTHVNRAGEFSGPHRAICGIVSGGESGPHARPAHPDWFRSVRDACEAAGVKYFHKQNGEWAANYCTTMLCPDHAGKLIRSVAVSTTERPKPHPVTYYANPREIKVKGPGALEHMTRVGKKRAGRLLDGQLHDDLPWRAKI